MYFDYCNRPFLTQNIVGRISMQSEEASTGIFGRERGMHKLYRSKLPYPFFLLMRLMVTFIKQKKRKKKKKVITVMI